MSGIDSERLVGESGHVGSVDLVEDLAERTHTFVRDLVMQANVNLSALTPEEHNRLLQLQIEDGKRTIEANLHTASLRSSE